MIRPAVKYERVVEFLSVLGFENPNLVSEVRLRAPRSIEVLVYATNHDGAKFIGDDGIALERITLNIERVEPEDAPPLHAVDGGS